MVDIDRIADWASSLTAAQMDNVPESVRAQMREARPELFEDALSKLFELTPRDGVIAVTLNWIQAATIAAYHGSRLTDKEAASVQTSGLIPLTARARRVRLERALSRHPPAGLPFSRSIMMSRGHL